MPQSPSKDEAVESINDQTRKQVDTADVKTKKAQSSTGKCI